MIWVSLDKSMLHMSRAMAHFMLLCTHFGTLRPSALCSTVLEPSVPQSTVLIKAQRESQRTVLQVQRRTAYSALSVPKMHNS